jgi:hypothetical protein
MAQSAAIMKLRKRITEYVKGKNTWIWTAIVSVIPCIHHASVGLTLIDECFSSSRPCWRFFKFVSFFVVCQSMFYSYACQSMSYFLTLNEPFI